MQQNDNYNNKKALKVINKITKRFIGSVYEYQV